VSLNLSFSLLLNGGVIVPLIGLTSLKFSTLDSCLYHLELKNKSVCVCLSVCLKAPPPEILK
jgi:hypothetical protein